MAYTGEVFYNRKSEIENRKSNYSNLNFTGNV